MMKRAMTCFVPMLFLGIAQIGSAKATYEKELIPSPPREFRAVWVATVANIDWPSTPGLSTDEQQKQALAILDKAKELHLNAIVFQVRPHADALYKSDLEPWSYYLTGQQGKAPDPFYDPLAFWVEQAHARGLELHAWFNPYRANHPANKSELSAKSIVKAHPELVRKLRTQGYYWMDPALKAVQDHSVGVVMDVVKRYDIDGVHFDDYFYPYREYNDNKDFPDDESWEAYKKSGGKLSRNDWRRDAVNSFIKRVYREIKATKPHVKFGISPFGIWRPGYPESIRGFDQYDILYADAKLWLNKGWVDYFTPQLYWPISQIPQSYPVLLGWWAKENTKKRHLWPGLSIGRAGREGGVNEVLNQIMVTRGMLPSDPGNVFFSMRTLMTNRAELDDALLKGPYQAPALVPPSPWLDSKPPAAPDVKIAKRKNELEISWNPQAKESPFLWVVYTKSGDKWNYEILPAMERRIVKDIAEHAITTVAVSAVDRNGNESKRAVVKTESVKLVNLF
jgi:uncharacterized lipoprotein YddW (UPF0748 family)